MSYPLTFLLALLLPTSALWAGNTKISGYDFYTKTESQLAFSPGKRKVLLFYSSTCPCSQSHFDHINQLKKDFAKFQFIGFNSSKHEKIEDVKKYYAGKNFDFPIFYDNKLKYADQYKALKTPHAYVLNKKGEIIFQGGVSNSRDFSRAKKFYLKDVLTAISQGKKSPLRTARALGCYIMR